MCYLYGIPPNLKRIGYPAYFYMIDTIKRNKIVNEVRDLLDKGFENIEIIIAENGFVINPSKVLKESNK